MKLHILLLLAMTATVVVGTSSCEKQELKNKRTVNQLYKDYRNGSISECTLDSQTVYIASLNAVDAGSTIFDINNETIGLCLFGWGVVDTICGQVTDCEVIYMVEDNIWGQPAVDKYGLR